MKFRGQKMDRIGETTWLAYTVSEGGEIEYFEFEADGMGQAERICREKGWMLDDDYWIPKVVRW
jgi:hypothetical protein